MPKTLPELTSSSFSEIKQCAPVQPDAQDEMTINELLKIMRPLLENAGSDLMSPRKEAVDDLLKKASDQTVQ